MSVTFRPATPADFERLLDLSIRAMRPHLERAGRFDPERRRARMRASFDPATTRLVEAEGAFAGCVAVVPHADHVEILNFYLEPALHGRGLGAAVLATIIAERPELPIRLEVLKHSPAARFYERAGFAAIGEQPFDIRYELPARVPA